MRLLIVLLPLAGCATFGPDSGNDREREAREYQRLDFRATFLEYRRRCYGAGGRIYVDATGNLDRDGVPPRGSRYACTTR